MRRTTSLLVVITIFTLVMPSSAHARSWKKELIQKIEETYKPTKISIWDGTLKNGMTVMVVVQSGVTAYLATDSAYPVTGVENGKLFADKAGSVQSMSRVFKKGERVLIFDLDIIENVKYDKDLDVIRVSLISVDADQRQTGGNTVSTRYKGALDFQFKHNYLQTADFAEIKKALNTTLVSDTEYQAADAPATVRLGMTAQQVEEALGKPHKVVDLGAKKLYVYPDMKITFVNGRVADVQ